MRRIALVGVTIMVATLIALYAISSYLVHQVVDLGPELTYQPGISQQIDPEQAGVE